MPYARRRKTGIAKRRYVRKATPKVSKATKRYVQTALKTNKETNWADVYSPANVELNYDVPLLVNISDISQGADIQSREGDRLQPMSLTGKFTLGMTGATTVARVIVFQWKPDDADDTPTVAKILSATADVNQINSDYIGSAVDRKKFKILYDRRFMNSAGVATYFPIGVMSCSKFHNKYIYYNSGTTTGKNNIYMLGISNVAVASTGPNLSGYFRLRWKDTA